jgi:DNA repair protein SbcC/Rad50
MQILSIYLKNIKSHRETELSFAPGINVLSGSNGAGKSTVFEAIGYALFGVDARDFVSNVDRFLSIGTKRGEICVTFRADDGETYRATRTVGTPAKWLLAKEKDGTFEVEEHARIEETEARLAELLGLANGRPLAEQFKLVIGPFQNEFLGPFAKKSAVDRKKDFDRILGVDSWQETYKATSGLQSHIKREIEKLQEFVRLKQEQCAVLPEKEAELATLVAETSLRQQCLTEKCAALGDVERRLLELDGREKALSAAWTDITVLEGRLKDGAEKIATQKLRVEEAQKAGVLLEESRAGKEAFELAEARLRDLREKEQRRRRVEKEVAALEQEAVRLNQAIDHERAEIEKTDRQLTSEESKLAEARAGMWVNTALAETAARLPDLRRELDLLKSGRSLLDGRRASLLEGKEKLAEGMCPFFREECRNIAGKAPRDAFSGRINDIDREMALLDEQVGTQAQKVIAAEKAEQELNAAHIRLQELEKQGAGLAGRRKENSERAGNLEKLTVEQVEAQARVAAGKTELQTFAGLDEEIGRTEKERSTLMAARDVFNAHQKDALDLANRLQTMENWQKHFDDLQQAHAARLSELALLREAYLPEQHQEARSEKDRLLAEVAQLRQQLEDMGRNRQRLESEICQLNRLKEEISGKQAEVRSFEEKEKLVTYLRNRVFKNVSSQLSERFREEISLRADRIYRTIAEADEELVWADGYRIVLRDMAGGQVRERSDDQLSGGQTMSAVVALRLALLQTIGARVAFFDEPTSNLDASRRENLAHAFRAIDVGREEVTEHWYDQLFLISHDVAFTEITDQMLQLGE